MPCLIGRRARDMGHPVCISCQRKGIKCQTDKIPEKTAVVAQRQGEWLVVRGLTLFTPNKYIGKTNGEFIYRKHRRDWERAVTGKFDPPPPGKMILEVRRIVDKSAALIKDETNLQCCVKPLEDALVASGALTDDRMTLLDRIITQSIDKKSPRIEIRIR